jgi:ABC-type sugar transport system ATPase subunit
MVFQDLALWPHMTVYKNIDFGLRALGGAKAERQRKIWSVLNKVNMQQYAHEYPSKLSGGQQQLVAIARAIVTEPKLLLMDEPLSNIDVRLREGIRQEIRRIQQETEITTVYVTHDHEDAFLLADRVAVMNAGTIEQIGSPEEIYFSPKSLFVARFVGESNVIPVKVTGPDRIATPWGELIWSTKCHEGKDAFLFFRPQQAKIEQDGRYTGTIIRRDLTVRGYKYRILTAENEVTLYNENLYETGKTVKFSIKDMRVLFF